MNVLFFGSYDTKLHPRVRVLIEGMRAGGDQVTECNIPLGRSTADRVALVTSSVGRVGFVGRLLRVWWGLILRSLGRPSPDVVIVGYMGQFDVLLARVRFPCSTIALDYLVSGTDTAADRSIGSALVRRGLRWLDRLALAASDVVIVDTAEHRDRLSPSKYEKVVVVPVGAGNEWFETPLERPVSRLKVVFFGLFTPLQGTPTIGRAVRELANEPIDFTMIGSGQDYEVCRAEAEGNPHVEWLDWVPYESLPSIVTEYDVCLGIFGSSSKALRVVPTKVFQGSAAGCVIVTSDTAVQRSMLPGSAHFVPPGDSGALAAVLRVLAETENLHGERVVSHRWALRHFTATQVTAPLRECLANAQGV